MSPTDQMTMAGLAIAIFACSMALGIVYFFVLARTVDALLGERHLAKVVGLTLLRIGGAIAVLALLAQLGPLMLLSGFFGFLGARLISTRNARRAG